MSALREMSGRVADAIATPNSPSGSCMKRKANWSQLTGPLTPRTRSTMVEAKFVFTATLTCTAAVPTMAGIISRMMRCNPGCDQSIAGRKENPARCRLGSCHTSCSAPPSTTPHAIPCMAEIPRYEPRPMPNATPNTTEPTLNSVDASAGTPNWLHALRTPIACAANATSSRNGNMIRVIVIASANFPGSAVSQPGASSFTNAGLNVTPRTHRMPTMRITAVPTRFARCAASSRRFPARYCEKVGTNAEESAPSAKRSRVRLGMRNPSENAS